MARQVGLAAQLVDADFLAITGDLTFGGKPIESYIIDTLNYYSKDRPVYFAPGLHDTEAIVHAWEEFGDACITRLRGMFAIAMWDLRRRRLVLARDRVGKKPLYYAMSTGSTPCRRRSSARSAWSRWTTT